MKVYSTIIVLLVIVASVIATNAIKDPKDNDPKVISFSTYLSEHDSGDPKVVDTYFVFTPKTCLACMQRVLMNYSELLAEPNVAILSSGAATLPEDVAQLLEGNKNLYWDHSGDLERSAFSKGGVVLILTKNDSFEFFPLTPKNFSEVIDREIPTAASVSFRY